MGIIGVGVGFSGGTMYPAKCVVCCISRRSREIRA